MNESFKLEGAAELYEALKDLPTVVKGQVLKSFTRKLGQEFIVKGLRSVIPWKSIKRGLTVKSAREDPTGNTAGPTSDVFWVRFVDGGTVERITKKGVSKGAIRGKNIIGPFIDSQIDPMLKYTNDELGNDIMSFLDKKLARLDKQIGK